LIETFCEESEFVEDIGVLKYLQEAVPAILKEV